MKTSIVAFAALGGWAAFASAQTANTSATFTLEPGVQSAAVRPLQARQTASAPYYGTFGGGLGAFPWGRHYSLEYLALADVADPSEGGGTGSAANLIGGGGRRSDKTVRFYRPPVDGVSAGASFTDEIDGDMAHRSWGMSIGFERGPFTLRAAHQNRHVAKVRMYDLAGNNMEAKNSLIAANLSFKWGTAYAAYSVSRGWGSSPLFNPDNPYGAGIAATPSTDSRDVLLGIAVPLGHATTLLASFIRRNDRDLANRDANQFAFGATYAMSRRTDFYAAYSRIQNTGGAGITLGNAGTRGSSNSALNIGMRHAF